MIRRTSAIILAILSLNTFAFAPQDSQDNSRVDAPVKVLNNMNLDNYEKSNPKGAQKLLLRMDIQAILKGIDGIIRVNQKHEGLEVYGSEVAYNIENGEIVSRDGRVAEIELDSIIPTLSMEQAMDIANQEIQTLGKLEASLKLLPQNGETFLTWHIEEKDFTSKWNYFVDAQSGEILHKFQTLMMNTAFGGSTYGRGKTSLGKNVLFKIKRRKFLKEYSMEVGKGYSRSTYNAKEQRVLPGDISTASFIQWQDSSLVDAHYYAGMFAKVLKKRFNRNSFDDKGTPIISTVHFGKSYINAFWNGTQMVYGDGGVIPGRNGKPDMKVAPLAGGFDVVAHEVSHAITTSSSNLRYYSESGALNEAFSDIMATYAEYKVQKKNFDWMLGEDIWDTDNADTALRYMNNPTADGVSYDYYPERYRGWGDNGGVHINSGIANLMFYLLSEGGLHPRNKTSIEVNGIGIERAIHYVYQAFTKKLVSSSKFSDARSAMIKVAQEEEASAEELEAIQDAWSAVGVE